MKLTPWSGRPEITAERLPPGPMSPERIEELGRKYASDEDGLEGECEYEAACRAAGVKPYGEL